MKKKYLLAALGIFSIGGFIFYNTKYKTNDNILKDNLSTNNNAVAFYTETDDGYVASDNIPTGEYQFNSEKSVCRVYDGTTSLEEASINNNIIIEYKDGKFNFYGFDKRSTRCYIYFDIVRDTTAPTITNLTTSVTKTAITINVTATDNKGVTEYWYQLDSNVAIKGVGSSHTFTGLTAGSTHTIKVYVKDAAGNQSATTTKSVTTSSPTVSETILANITPKTTTPDFSQVATPDEGVYKVSDGMYGGYSYYWRGAVTNNYIKFGTFCWRIIRINGDGSLRLIYDGASCHANGTNTTESIAKANVAYNTSYNQSNYVGWTYTGTSQRTLSGTSSNAKTELESWYSSNLASHASKVADGKFCNNRNARSGDTWSLKGSTFYYEEYANRNGDLPTLTCNSGDTYTLKVGLITTSEAIFAGGKSENNASYYLYNGQDYWTMSPYQWDGYAGMLRVQSSGYLGDYRVQYTCGLRPVINLKSDITFSSGNGTLENPYVVQ